MKKLLTMVALMTAVVFACAGCSSSLFSDESTVKFGDTYTHTDPKDLTYDDRIVLKGDSLASALEEYANADTYPDTMMYDDDGNVIGMYDYDETTGLARGWTNIQDGAYTAFPEGQEVDLGMPDESKMIRISGDVSMGAVVYGNKDEAVSAYLYVFLSDASAKDAVETAMESAFGLTLTEESDTVLSCVQDADYIADQFAQEEDAGYTVDSKNAEAYAEILKQMYGLSTYGGENPYKPYADHQDPEDLQFDEKVVMTGSGQMSVQEGYEKDITSITDYVYGYEGNVVAQYTYYECPSKEAADELMEKCFQDVTTMERISDTVIRNSVDGQTMQDTVQAYIGYSVLKDSSLTDYVRMLQETFGTSVYE